MGGLKFLFDRAWPVIKSGQYRENAMKRKRGGTTPQDKNRENIRVIRAVIPEYKSEGYPIGAKLRAKKP